MSSTATIVGNLTRDPEVKFTSSGKAMCRFSVAVSKRVQVDGQWQDGPTSFYDIVTWGQLAENVAASVGKGSRVIVHGRLEQSSWETDGVKKSKVELVADEVGAALSRATVDVHRVSRDLVSAPAAEEPF